jgi:CheY-like chemotaxis protein
MLPTSMPAQAGHRLEASTILVVEDEVLIRLMISEYLREFGYKVVEARNAAEATRILQSDEPVEIVFSDIRMPGDMNGIGLAQWIGRNKPGVGVVLTSAHVQPKDLAGQACADAPFVEKPYVPYTVLKCIRAQLNHAA